MKFGTKLFVVTSDYKILILNVIKFFSGKYCDTITTNLLFRPDHESTDIYSEITTNGKRELNPNIHLDLVSAENQLKEVLAQKIEENKNERVFLENSLAYLTQS